MSLGAVGKKDGFVLIHAGGNPAQIGTATLNQKPFREARVAILRHWWV